MGANILRNFYYMDSETIDEYLSSIDGAIFDSEDVSERLVDNKGVAGGLALPPVKLSAGTKSQIETETRKKVIQTYAGKFQKIYSYLEHNGTVPFYDTMDDDSWNSISRNQFVELDVTIRFSKMDSLLSSFSHFMPMLGEIDESIHNDDTKKVFYIMQLISKATKQSGLPAELQLINESKYKFVSYFNQNCFIKNFDLMPSEVTVLAKIQRKLKENEKIDLVNIVPMLEKMAINREMRKSMKLSTNELPNELVDNVKGPGALIIPIAVYN